MLRILIPEVFWSLLKFGAEGKSLTLFTADLLTVSHLKYAKIKPTLFY